MPSVHLLNVAPGDCTIIQHASGHVTMLDICDGNIDANPKDISSSSIVKKTSDGGNYRMCSWPTNPIDYLKTLGVSSIFRFALTHPDMDHMDGFNAMIDGFQVNNFWDTGSRRNKPDFSGGPYLEKDWDRYAKVRDGKETGVSTAIRQAGSRFAFANQNEEGTAGGDGLHILAPDGELIKDSNMNDDLNDGSYVILYRSAGGRILLPGDAHDKTWDYVLKNSLEDVKECSFMLAPHHGRDSARSYEFLEKIRPKLTLIGCSPSEYIDYSQWTRRGLEYITSNQAGNVVLEVNGSALDVFVENHNFVVSRNGSVQLKNKQGYAYLGTIYQ